MPDDGKLVICIVSGVGTLFYWLWGVVFDALEIVPVVGVCQTVTEPLNVVRAAPAPTPVLHVAVGKSEVGTPVVLLAREATPGVVLARCCIALIKVGGVAGGGVGVDES